MSWWTCFAEIVFRSVYLCIYFYVYFRWARGLHFSGNMFTSILYPRRAYVPLQSDIFMKDATTHSLGVQFPRRLEHGPSPPVNSVCAGLSATPIPSLQYHEKEKCMTKHKH